MVALNTNRVLRIVPKHVIFYKVALFDKVEYCVFKHQMELEKIVVFLG